MTPTSDERFAEVFRQHYPRLVVLARRVFGDTGEAEDAAQEAMLALRTNAVSERSDDDIAAWLNRVVTNGSLNRLRGRRRAEVRAEVVAAREARSDGDGPGDAVIAVDLRHLGHPDERAADVREELGYDELDRERVRACLAVLPARQATALLLRHAGHSYREIAATLDVAEGSVGVLLARGERAFRRAHEEMTR